MDNLKFRAWDVFNADMFPRKTDDDLLVKFFRDVNKRRNGGNCVHVMQFTGLNDCNGKEIYEGDILRTIHFIHDGKTHYLHHIVQWSDAYHGWQALSASSMNENDGSPQLFVYIRETINNVYEVVGNIYETPELLEQAA